MDIYPSLLAVFDSRGSDPEALCAAARAVQAAGVAALHIDVMAPPFTPRTTFQPSLIPALRAAGVTLPLDVHLMTGPEALHPWLEHRPASLSFHAKMWPDEQAVSASLTRIHAHGCRPGLALDADESLDVCEPFAGHETISFIMMMTVKAGAGGQPLNPELLSKIKEARHRWPHLPVVADGGVNASTLFAVAGAGAAAAVAGSAVFSGPNLTDNLQKLYAAELNFTPHTP